MLSVIYADFDYPEYCHAACLRAECRYADRCYDTCLYAACILT